MPFIDSSRSTRATVSSAICTSRSACCFNSGIAATSRFPNCEAVADLHHVVDDIVELLGQGVDVLTIERGDERRVEPPQDLPDQLVAAPLAGDNGLQTALCPVEQLTQPAGAVGHVRRRLVEQLEEPIVGRQADGTARSDRSPANGVHNEGRPNRPGATSVGHEVGVSWSRLGKAR